jgi:formylglycine-generating enzyme required for sulfatase activity
MRSGDFSPFAWRDRLGSQAQRAFSSAGFGFYRFRGGSWIDRAGTAALADRGINSYPDYRYNNFGFRLARSSGN